LEGFASTLIELAEELNVLQSDGVDKRAQCVDSEVYAVADDENHTENQYLNDTVQASKSRNFIDNAPYY
jgi:hypothetical protein